MIEICTVVYEVGSKLLCARALRKERNVSIPRVDIYFCTAGRFTKLVTVPISQRRHYHLLISICAPPGNFKDPSLLIGSSYYSLILDLKSTSSPDKVPSTAQSTMAPLSTFILSSTVTSFNRASTFRSSIQGRPVIFQVAGTRRQLFSPIFVRASADPDNTSESSIDPAAAERAINQSVPVNAKAGETADVVADIVSKTSPVGETKPPVTPSPEPVAPEFVEDTAQVGDSAPLDTSAMSSAQLEQQAEDLESSAGLDPSVESQPAVAKEDPLEGATGETDTGSSRPGGMRRRRRRIRPKREVKYQLEDLETGMELEGVVRSITDYGAFISELGTPTDGLVHVSQLSADYIENVSDVVSLGDKVNVRVLGVDLEKKTISLTMKTAEELAESRTERRENARAAASAARREEQKRKWDEFTFDPEVFIDVKIISITDFGAFCELVDENGARLESAPTDGLIHISEVSTHRVENVSDFLEIDQITKARVLATDPKRNRLSLSLKPLPESRDEMDSDMGSVKRSPRRSDRRKSRDMNRESIDVAAEMEKAEADQPEFKSSFELAFERAQARAASEN